MRLRTRVTFAGFLLILFTGVISVGTFGAWEEFQASSFNSTGDQIQGWYWLRDQYLTDRAEWRFRGLPEGEGDLQLEVHALATDRVSGRSGVDARFRLLVGSPGQGTMGGVFCPQKVTIQNISSPGDPDGYNCRGTVTVQRTSQCGTTGSEIFVMAERISSAGPHVAFNRGSVTMKVSAGTGFDTGGQFPGSSGGEDIDTAQPVNAGTFIGSLGEDRRESWYEVSLTAGQVISVTLVPAPDADFEIRLYGPEQGSLESGYSSTGEPAELSYVVAESGIFYLKVDRSSGEGNYQVNLQIQNQNDAASGGDASDYGIQAYPIGPGSFSGFLKDDDDDDWYHFDVTKGQIISADLNVPEDADFDFYLYKPSGSTAESGHSSRGEPAEISYVAGESGIYFIKVHRSSGEGTYQFYLQLQNQNDAGSGGDASDYGIQAYPIGPGSFSGFLKDDDDDDWYHFDVTKGQIISADLNVPEDADFDFYLYRPSGSTAESGHSSRGEPAEISYVAGESGIYFIKVHRSSGEGNYQLSLNISGQGVQDYGSDGVGQDYVTDDTQQGSWADVGEEGDLPPIDVELPEPNGADIPF